MDNVFNAGQPVPYSGVYRITHYPPHTGEEIVTLTQGTMFPCCVHCSHAAFMLLNELSTSEVLNYSHEL